MKALPKLLVLALAVLPALARAQGPLENYAVGTCLVDGHEQDKGGALDVNIDDKKKSESGHAIIRSLTGIDGFHVPLQGFSFCDSTVNGPVGYSARLAKSKDGKEYERIMMVCGARKETFTGKVIVVLEPASRKIVFADFQVVRHGMIFDSPVAWLKCGGDEYAALAAVFDKPEKTVSGVVSKGVFKNDAPPAK